MKRKWNRTALFWDYRRDGTEGLKTNELEPTAKSGCFLLIRVSSCFQNDKAGVAHFRFALLDTSLKDEDAEAKIAHFFSRLLNAKEKVFTRSDERRDLMISGNSYYLTFKVKFYPDNKRNFTVCTLDLFEAILRELGIERRAAGSGSSSCQTYVWHKKHWVEHLGFEEVKRGMADRVIVFHHCEDDF